MQRKNALNRDEFKRKFAADFVKLIENEGGKFMMPFISLGMPINLARMNTKNPYYYGVNNFILWWASRHFKFKSNIWGTYNQIKDKGGQVLEDQKKKATQVVLWKPFETKGKYKRNTGDKKVGDDRTISSVYLAFFWVYNMDQTTLAKQYEKSGDGSKTKINAEQYVKNTGARIEHGGDRCFYEPSKDYIQMVDKKMFIRTGDSNATVNYYSTLFHELVHWTGHESRLKRSMQDYFGSDGYAAEELVAESGAAMLSCLLGITSKPKRESAQYIKSWMKKIKGDPDAIMNAIGKAGSAVKYLDSLQPGKDAKNYDRSISKKDQRQESKDKVGKTG